jgi:post-segregation antitoxin (ccd killing protein)
MRKKLTLRVESDLVQQAKAVGINLSRLMEKAIAASIGNHTYMHVQSDIVQAEM